MTAEFEIFKKDLIKINIYKEVVLDNTVSLKFFLDNNKSGNDYFIDIHNDDVVVNRYGCFNISEDKNTGSITIRPALVKFSLKIGMEYKQSFSEQKTLTICRNGKNDIEKTFDITSNCESIELALDGEKYILKINYTEELTNDVQDAAQYPAVSDNSENIHKETSDEKQESTYVSNNTDIGAASEPTDVNTGHAELDKEISKDKLEAIKSECEKDYEQYAEKLEMLKEDYNFDRSLIEYYKENDLVPIEKIFSEIGEKIKEAEKQINLFIEARKNKTKEIQE